MSAPDLSRASWRLKLARAKKHLEEFERLIRAYGDRHPYEARRRNQSKKDRRVWRYHLAITEPPGPELSIVLGDTIHNLRASLDHLVVAMVPQEAKKSTGFPIEHRDIWAKDGRRFRGRTKADVEARRAFGRRIKAVPAEAQTIIERVQPYWEDPPEGHFLYLLNRLENADKHRRLILVLYGLFNVRVRLVVRAPGGRHLATPLVEHLGFCKHDAKLIQAPPPRGHTTESEVQVQVRGAPMIAVDVGLRGQYCDIVKSLHQAIDFIEEDFFPSLERFVST